ncbi:MAG TPA: ATP-binding protein [Pirellulales bacterium]|jgi:signal transduction histidine kinase|nr:ATP-binding protein [Pirellulales bacterium]
MSYSSFKRVLGETKLELKTLLLFGVCLLTLIAASFYWYGSRTEQQVYEQKRWMGVGLVNAILTNYHAIKFEQDTAFKDSLAAMLNAWADEKYSWSFLRARPTDGNGEPQDEFEVQVLEDFKRLPPPAVPGQEGAAPFRYRRFADRQEFDYYQAVRAMDQNCVLCHNAISGAGVPIGGAFDDERRPLALGDLMAVVKVVIPDKETQKALTWNNAILWATAIITVFLAIVASYLIIRYVIVKPLKHLRDVSDEISRGNTSLRADIQTGDEFEELAVAFNRMLRHMLDAQGKLREVNASLDTKVDELAQANMQLYEMNRLKSDFLATMSHELRTPLNSIIGFSDVLSAINSLDDKQRRYVLNIQKSGRVLLDMINDILDLAKIESGKMEVRLSEFKVEHLIHAQCDMAKPLTERKNIDLEVEVAPGLPTLYQDQGKVQQILNNLLSNAIKFTPEGGRIVVRARPDEHGQLLLDIEDTGIGIAEEDQTAIFEKFRQGSAVLSGGDAMTREYSGTGLGLSIVKELCKLLGGEISLVSLLGQGSTFTVHLPVSRAPSPPKLESPADSATELIQPRRSEPRQLEEALGGREK